MKPTNIQIIKNKGEGYFRLRYRCNGKSITSSGFNTKEELAEIIKEDGLFVLNVRKRDKK